jgi:hypothetical protein
VVQELVQSENPHIIFVNSLLGHSFFSFWLVDGFRFTII